MALLCPSIGSSAHDSDLRVFCLTLRFVWGPFLSPTKRSWLLVNLISIKPDRAQHSQRHLLTSCASVAAMVTICRNHLAGGLGCHSLSFLKAPGGFSRGHQVPVLALFPVSGFLTFNPDCLSTGSLVPHKPLTPPSLWCWPCRGCWSLGECSP